MVPVGRTVAVGVAECTAAEAAVGVRSLAAVAVPVGRYASPLVVGASAAAAAAAVLVH